MNSMKKVCAFFVAMALLLPFTMSAAAQDSADPNAEIMEREYQIEELLDERDRILAEEPVDIMELNTVELELMDLGVTFLTDAQAAAQFPDAYESLQGTDVNTEDPYGVAPCVEVPIDAYNRWILHSTNNYEYMGEYYNIQRLTAEPLKEAPSSLWDEGMATVNYSWDWDAGVTTFMHYAVEGAISEFTPIISTVYDVLSSVWDAIKPVSIIDASEVVYRWENKTTASFMYVYPRDGSEADQKLALVTTKCSTDVAYIVDVDSWSENGDGTKTPNPAQISGSWNSAVAPLNSAASFAMPRACYLYVNNLVDEEPECDVIERILISGPESKRAVYIRPLQPWHPAIVT